jgi:hypothetical protein
MSYKIIDNFLDKNLYDTIKLYIQSDQIPWYLKQTDVLSDKKTKSNGFFNFCYYNNDRPDHPFFDPHITPILKKLKSITCIQVRVNLVVRDIDTKESLYHTDVKSKNTTTAILYFTTCNAKTILNIDNKKIYVDSVENRILIFNSNILHKVKYQTDTHKRYVMNFNYVQ